MRLTLAPLSNFDIGAAVAAIAAFAALRFGALDAGGALAAGLTTNRRGLSAQGRF